MMIELENRFRHPNQSTPKSMDAVFVRTIGVHENAQCCWVRCPNSAEKIWSKPFILFPWLRCVTKNDCQLRMENCVFAFLKAITPIPTRILLRFFFDRKHVGKNSAVYSPPERWADWNTHWWCPKTSNPAGGTFLISFGRHPLCNAKWRKD